MDAALDRIARQLDAFLRPEEDLRQARKRERILDSATRQFIAHGYRKASVDEIARDAGIAKGTLYLYYRTKAELLLHAVTREKQGYLVRLAALREPDLSGLARLHGFILLGLTLGDELPLVARLMRGDREIAQAMEEVGGDVLGQVEDLRLGLTRELIQDASDRPWPADELHKRARVLIGLMSGVLSGAAFGAAAPGAPAALTEEYARLLADVVVTGVVNPVDPRLRQHGVEVRSGREHG